MSYASIILADSPAVYYALDEASGPTAADGTGNGHNATFELPVTFHQSGPDGVFAIGLGGFFDFGFLETSIGDWCQPDGGSYSAEIWFNTTNDTDQMVLWNGVTWLGVGITTPGIPTFYDGSDETSWTTTVNDGEWHQLVGVRDATAGKSYLYVDGTKVATSTSSPSVQTALEFKLGTLGGGFQYEGLLSRFSYYPTALTDDQVLIHFGGTPTTTTLPVTNSHIFFSPYNWFSDGSGSLSATNILPTSTYAESNTPGAYLKTVVDSSTADGSFNLLIDTSKWTSGGIAYNDDAHDTPTLLVVIDGTRGDLIAPAPGDTSVAIASGLAEGAHTILVYFRGIGLIGDGQGARWGTDPASTIKITGVTIDVGSTLQAPSVFSDSMIVYGDSIGEGIDVNSDGFDQASQDASVAYGLLLGADLNCEVGNVSFAFQGYNVVGSDVPILLTSYPLYWEGKSRLVGGVLSPVPKYIIDGMGTNGTYDTSDIETMLGHYRTIGGADAVVLKATPIGYGSPNTANIKTGVTAYEGEVTDLTFLADTLTGMINGDTSYDGTHPNVATQVLYANAILAGMPSFSTVGTPVFSPVAGTYDSTQSVTITSSTDGATIKYTTDGTTPSDTHGTTYSAAISVAASETVKAIAFKHGLDDSSVASASYTITLPGGYVLLHSAVDNASSTAADARSIGVSSISVVDGSSFGSPTSDSPLYLSVYRATSPVGFLSCTGRSTNTLTGISPVYDDFAVQVGDTIACRQIAEYVNDLKTNVDLLVAAGSGGGGGGSTSPGGSSGQVQFNASGAFEGDSALTFNAGSGTLTSTIVAASDHITTPSITTGDVVVTAGGTLDLSAGATVAGGGSDFANVGSLEVGSNLTCGNRVQSNYFTDFSNNKGYIDTLGTFFTDFVFVNRNPDNLPLAIQLASSQVNDSFQIIDHTGAALTLIRNDGSLQPASVADSAAVNNSLYFSTTGGKLAYKDSSGTVNLLY